MDTAQELGLVEYKAALSWASWRLNRERQARLVAFQTTVVDPYLGVGIGSRPEPRDLTDMHRTDDACLAQYSVEQADRGLGRHVPSTPASDAAAAVAAALAAGERDHATLALLERVVDCVTESLCEEEAAWWVAADLDAAALVASWRASVATTLQRVARGRAARILAAAARARRDEVGRVVTAHSAGVAAWAAAAKAAAQAAAPAPTAAGSTQQASGAGPEAAAAPGQEDGTPCVAAARERLISQSAPGTVRKPLMLAHYQPAPSDLIWGEVAEAAMRASDAEARAADGTIVRTMHGDVLRVRCVRTGDHFDVGLSGFCEPHPPVSCLRPGLGVPKAWPHQPSPQQVVAALRDYVRAPGVHLRPDLPPPAGWHAAELEVGLALGEPPPVDDEVEFSAYQAEYAARLRDHPAPLGALGAALWAAAKQCSQHAAEVAAAARAAALEPRVTAANAARAAALAAEEAAAIEAAIEDAEWREEEKAYRRAQVETLRWAGSHGLADYLEEHGDDLAAAGVAP